MRSNYLFELGTEELPPKALLTLSNSLCSSVKKAFKTLGLTFETFTPYCSPRRLAFVVEGLDDQTALKENKVFGPPVKIAFDAEGNPSKAALAFCSRNNISIDQIGRESDGKVEKIVCSVKQGGESTSSLLAQCIDEALANLPIAKRMRWGASRTEFVRPVHWLILLKNDSVIDAEILDLKSSNISRGHRFLSDGEITIKDANLYAQQLKEQGKVIACFQTRRDFIEKQVKALATELGGTAVIDSNLLDEVSALVEWPVALAGNFDARFLDVPASALISSMKEHQKYFHLVDKDGTLLPAFITISNIESDDYSAIISGNEKVIRPRLADAAFFFETDKKISSETRRKKLKTVVFQNKLGTVFDKTERIKNIALHLAEQLALDANAVQRAAELCKSDLVSHMVFEFPEMQGVAGYHYALNDGESEAIAQAIVEHYQPKFAGDSIPASPLAALISLADRIDTLTGIFGIGQPPTGSKDPFALRRAAVAVLRIIVESGFSLDLKTLIEFSAKQFGDLKHADTVVDKVLSYVLERFKASYEEQGIPGEVFQSVHSRNLSTPLDIHQRVLAVADFYKLPEAITLAGANKRVSNILAKFEGEVASHIDTSLLNDNAEKALAEHLDSISKVLEPLFTARNYNQALIQLATLNESVNRFFDEVMVMDDDLALRNNRIALLNTLRGLFLHIADISYLAPTKK